MVGDVLADPTASVSANAKDWPLPLQL